MKIAYVVNPSAGQSAAMAPVLEVALRALGAEWLPLVWVDNALSEQDTALLSEADVAVVLGGDGTIMHVAKAAAEFSVPVLGVNGGTVGFMAGLEMDQLDRLPRLLGGQYTIENRMMLDVTLEQATGVRHLTALNEAVVSHGNLSRLVQLEVFSDGNPVTTYRADGVIVATPTGSTAYSLSAGGPIVDPSLECLLLTPICPHAMHTRPYLFSDRVSLTVQASSEAYLTVDAEQAVPLCSGDRVIVRRHPVMAQLISLKEEDAFYDILTQKLIDRR